MYCQRSRLLASVVRDATSISPVSRMWSASGGGVAGCELGQVLARFGVQITLVEAADRLLPAEEPEASQALQAALVAEGRDVHTRAAVQRVGSRDGSIRVTRAGGAVIESERLLVATGEMLGLLTLAVHARVSLAELRSMIFAFPTFYWGIGEALRAYGRGLATVLDPGCQGVQAPDEVQRGRRSLT